MYHREKPMSLKSSTSALYNNLSIHINMDKKLINYAVVHKAVVNIVGAFMDGSSVNHKQVICKEPSATHATSMIMQSRMLPFPGRIILVIASQKGIQMFEDEGSVMLYWYAIEESKEASMSYARGICQVGTDTICVGNHRGHISVFDIPARGTNITLSETLKEHSSGVCDLQSVGNQMVSSDDSGNIMLWQSKGRFQLVRKIPGNRSPCTTVGLYEDCVVGAFGDGHLRVFSARSGQLQVEVAAHARWITAMDVAPSNGLIVTVGDDTFVKVWKVHAGPDAEVKLKYSDCVTDLMLQGAQFITKDGKAIALTGYDSNDILFYRQG